MESSGMRAHPHYVCLRQPGLQGSTSATRWLPLRTERGAVKGAHGARLSRRERSKTLDGSSRERRKACEGGVVSADYVTSDDPHVLRWQPDT